jgi:hypothetical protein
MGLHRFQCRQLSVRWPDLIILELGYELIGRPDAASSKQKPPGIYAERPLRGTADFSPVPFFFCLNA